MTGLLPKEKMAPIIFETLPFVPIVNRHKKHKNAQKTLGESGESAAPTKQLTRLCFVFVQIKSLYFFVSSRVFCGKRWRNKNAESLSCDNAWRHSTPTRRLHLTAISLTSRNLEIHLKKTY